MVLQMFKHKKCFFCGCPQSKNFCIIHHTLCILERSQLKIGHLDKKFNRWVACTWRYPSATLISVSTFPCRANNRFWGRWAVDSCSDCWWLWFVINISILLPVENRIAVAVLRGVDTVIWTPCMYIQWVPYMYIILQLYLFLPEQKISQSWVEKGIHCQTPTAVWYDPVSQEWWTLQYWRTYWWARWLPTHKRLIVDRHLMTEHYSY